MKVAFIKIARIFHIERYFVIYPHKCTAKNWRKVPGKVGECIFDSQKCKSFQGPKAGPGPRPIFYGSLRLPDFASLRRQNIGKNFWGPPLHQILDPLLKICAWDVRRSVSYSHFKLETVRLDIRTGFGYVNTVIYRQKGFYFTWLEVCELYEWR